MKTIQIDVPAGKKAIQVERDGKITISFEDKPISWENLETFDEFYTVADDQDKADYEADEVVSPDSIAYKQLRLIIAVANTDPDTMKKWIPNWKDTTEKKWFPVFKLSSGFGFSCSAYVFDYGNASVGSRLCSKNEHISSGLAKKFLPLYEQFFTI